MTLLIAGSACVLIAKMLRASHVQADALVRERTLHLWENQFRQDGRQSQSAQVVAGAADMRSIEFQQGDARVTYRVIPSGLERSVNGELGGRWECGAGEWTFGLLEEGQIVRAEFRQAEALSLLSNGPLPKGAPDRPLWTHAKVDVALAAKPADSKPEGDK